MVEDTAAVLRRSIARRPDDPSGAGVDDALAELVSAGLLRGVRIRPFGRAVTHEHGTVDPADQGSFAFAAEAIIEFSPSDASPTVAPMLPTLTTAFVTGLAAARRIAEASAGPASVRRADGLLLTVNRAHATLTGRQPDSEPDPDEDVHPEDRARLLASHRRLLHEDTAAQDIRIRRVDGTEVPVRSESVALRWPSGALRFIVSHLHDLTELRQLEHRLQTGAVLQRVIEEAPIAIALRDEQLRCEWANDTYVELVGRSLDELRGTLPDDLIDHRDYGPIDRGSLLSGEQEVVQRELRYLRPDGTVRLVRTQAARLDLPDIGTKYLSFAEDLTDARAREAEHRQLRRRLETTLRHAPGVIAIYDLDAEPLFSSLGRSERASLRHLVADGSLDRSVLDRTLAVIETGRADRWSAGLTDQSSGRQRWFETSCAPILDDDGRVEGAVSIAIDRSEQHDAEKRLAHQATHDLLTGLLDRTGLVDGMESLVDEPHAVLFVDLDDFKDVNDSLGHDVGDELLHEVADRLRDTTGADDLVARPGGDEFVVVTPSDDLTAAMELADRILLALDETHVVRGASIPGSASIGVAAIAAGTSPHEALRRADVAMYEAKRRGRNRVAGYDVGLEERTERRLRTTSGLRRALDQGELVVHYQPEVDLVTGELLGAEALLRWDDPERGRLVAAGEFIEIAEHAGLIDRIGRVVMAQAARDASSWPDDLLLRVNVSARQLDDPRLLDMILGELATSGLAPARLCVELTETALADPDSLRRIHELSAAGITIALDDFGTGFSSLALLRTLPVDVIKIDRTFVSGLGTDEDDTAIVHSIIGLAGALDLDVVAEGVETAEQARLLLELGCRRAQGFGLGRPLPVEGLRARFADRPAEDLTGRR